MNKFRYTVGEDEQGKFVMYPTAPSLLGKSLGDFTANLAKSYVGAIDTAIFAELPIDVLQAIHNKSKEELERRLHEN